MAKASVNKKITHAVVRMYCMGTGDCFIIKFFAGEEERFKMMIDCGVWSRPASFLEKYIADLKAYVNNEIDLLVVTHEHTDHVSVFEACRELFVNDFTVHKIWMGWSEDDSLPKIKRWKTLHGEKKVALAMAAEKLEQSLSAQRAHATGTEYKRMLQAKEDFAMSLKSFAELHVIGAAGQYKGNLEGMRIVKKEIASGNNIEYLYPGDIIEDMENLEGIRFYVMGPPEKWSEVETEGGEEGESYTHNKELRGTDAFAASILSAGSSVDLENILPFDKDYETASSNTQKSYQDENEAWRKIDDDWLFSAGSLALRINSLTNNLSLVLAIEFEDSKKVMLFPGDAEYGSWKSWHEIKWKGVKPVEKDIHFTEDLLRRTVFYKVAHHMSHNGTAERLGLNMMVHNDLAAMATLNYDSIAPKWKNTMPNREMLQELLDKTKGRVMIMKDSDLFFDFKEKEPLPGRIAAAQKKMNATEKKKYKQDYFREKNNLYVEYTVRGQ